MNQEVLIKEVRKLKPSDKTNYGHIIGSDSNAQTDVQCRNILSIGHSIWNNSKTTDH